MKRLCTLTILGALLLACVPMASAAPQTSDWPALGSDAAQSNFNPVEKTLRTGNVLKLKVRWTSTIAAQSYPIVAAGRVYVPVVYKGRVHVRVLDAATGAKVSVFSRDALGGMLYVNGTLYLAGKSLQSFDSSGALIAQIKGPSSTSNSTFAYPEWDGKTLFTGYSTKGQSSIYTIDPTTAQLAHKLSSTSALGVAMNTRIVTNIAGGSAVYAASGKAVAKPAYFGSYWFASTSLAYDVASVNRKNARVYAVDATGHFVWSRTVGPAIATQGSEWPHACSSTALYVATLRPQVGVQALDALTGRVLWTRSIPDVQRVALANNVVFVLTYGLGRPVRLVFLNATTGKILGAIVLSANFFTFDAPNQLMVADGSVFIRVTGPGGDELVALGLPKP